MGRGALHGEENHTSYFYESESETDIKKWVYRIYYIGMTDKTCYRCGETKSVELFAKKKNLCKHCHNEDVKQHYHKNRETILQNQADYREYNQETISEKRKEKYVCECGSTIRKENKKLHESTTKHKNFVAGIEKEVLYVVYYYDEDDNNKKKVIRFTKHKYEEFQKAINRQRINNFKVLKMYNFI